MEHELSQLKVVLEEVRSEKELLQLEKSKNKSYQTDESEKLENELEVLRKEKEQLLQKRDADEQVRLYYIDIRVIMLI